MQAPGSIGLSDLARVSGTLQSLSSHKCLQQILADKSVTSREKALNRRVSAFVHVDQQLWDAITSIGSLESRGEMLHLDDTGNIHGQRTCLADEQEDTHVECKGASSICEEDDWVEADVRVICHGFQLQLQQN